MGGGSPTQRSLNLLRENGYLAEVVERWNPFAKVRHDLFGVIDILGVHPEHGTLAVQTTSVGNLAARVQKVQESPHLENLKRAGWKIEVHGWRKPSKKERTWTVRVEKI